MQCEAEESTHTEEVLSISKGSSATTKTIGFSKKRKLYNVSSEVFIGNEGEKIVKDINNCYNKDNIEQNVMQNTHTLSEAIKKQMPPVKTKTVDIEKYKKCAQFVYTLENLCQEIQINNTINKKLLLDKVINKKSKYYSNLQKERRKLNRRQNSGSEVIKILQNRLKMDEKEFGIIIKFMDRYKSLAEFNQTATEEILIIADMTMRTFSDLCGKLMEAIVLIKGRVPNQCSLFKTLSDLNEILHQHFKEI